MGIGIKELLIILLLVLIIFGTKRLRNIGSDLGAAIKGFKKSVNEGEHPEQHSDNNHAPSEKKQLPDEHSDKP